MLKNHVTLYVPSTHDVGQPLTETEYQELVQSVSKYFALRFGGCTNVPGFGFWVDSTGKIISESVTLVTSYHEQDSKEAENFAVNIAKVIKTTYRQEAITVETQEGIQFI